LDIVYEKETQISQNL